MEKGNGTITLPVKNINIDEIIRSYERKKSMDFPRLNQETSCYYGIVPIPSLTSLRWCCQRNKPCDTCGRQGCTFRGRFTQKSWCQCCESFSMLKAYSAKVCTNKDCIYYTENTTWFYCTECQDSYDVEGCETCKSTEPIVDIGLSTVS
jgi:hypothetical protein